MGDLPVPKFRIGDTVWIARTSSQSTMLPCPDCKNTRKWLVTTPAGAQFECACQRCGAYTPQRGLPSLEYQRFAGYVESRTIGSVRLDSADKVNPVSYMAYETGIGNGNIYYERGLFDSEAAAKADADAQAAVQNAKVVETPAHLEKVLYSELRLRDALLENAEKAATASWWNWRHLVNAVSEHVKEPGGSLADLRSELEYDLEFYRAQSYTPDLENIIQALAANDLEGARAAAKTILDLHAAAVHAHEDAKPAPEAEDQEGGA